jgi:NADH-quinone oxidoreductase subunit A
MGQWLPIVVLGALAGVFAGVSLLVSGLLNKRRPNAAKNAPYECGVTEQVPPPQRLSVRFYLVAMIFVIFDIEIIFLYPYAVVHDRLGLFGLLAVVEFAVAVFASLIYLVANGALTWGPAVRARNSLLTRPERTIQSTVRRVGDEGRSVVASPSEAA